MNTAIIVAAGSGTRFGGDRPKQFVELLGKPLILHTLERFEECPAVDEVVLVLSDVGMKVFGRNPLLSSITKLRSIVAGGETRAGSVKNGFRAAERSSEIVAVHDGARPLVTSDEIARTISVAAYSGAACLVAAVTDTIKRIEAGRIIDTIDRDQLRRALTPQAFRYDLLKRAIEAGPPDETVTDECQLVERLGVSITCVDGDPRNIKVTRAEDLAVAEMHMKGKVLAFERR